MSKLQDQKKNIIILTVLAVLIAVVAVFGFGNRTRTTAPQGEMMNMPGMMDLIIPSAGAEGVTDAAQQSDAPVPEVTPVPELNGRVLVSLSGSGQYGWLPVYKEGEYVYPIVQTDKDGNMYENRVHVTSDSVWMEYSTCENQDCVGEGVVTFENKETRILGNFIICLPNQVTLELFTEDEVQAMYSQSGADQ
ncbi:MAG: NusG domain II-containing protein [Clostridia bacterium]|nr:NusG domain II-containing protein [Clostridia bacterium]